MSKKREAERRRKRKQNQIPEGCQVYYDAFDGLKRTPDGRYVWRDRSGNGNHAIFVARFERELSEAERRVVRKRIAFDWGVQLPDTEDAPAEESRGTSGFEWL